MNFSWWPLTSSNLDWYFLLHPSPYGNALRHHHWNPFASRLGWTHDSVFLGVVEETRRSFLGNHAQKVNFLRPERLDWESSLALYRILVVNNFYQNFKSAVQAASSYSWEIWSYCNSWLFICEHVFFPLEMWTIFTLLLVVRSFTMMYLDAGLILHIILSTQYKN